MNSLLKSKWPGYIVLALLIFFIINYHMLFFFITLLFIYLFTDVFTNGIKKFFNIPSWILFNAFYIILIGIFLLISLRILPKFIDDLPQYLDQLKQELIAIAANISVKYNIHLDYNTLKVDLLAQSSKSINEFFLFFRKFFKVLIFFIFALVLNFLLFTDRRAINALFTRKRGSFMTYLYNFMIEKIGIFYFYFKKVMGGQVIISFINAIITLAIVIILNLPHKTTLVCLVFLFGLIPIFGNIISNTILSVTALISKGIIACVICLIFLIGIHKLEYFLNSKIIGQIVRLPMFVTLLSLLIAEALFGLAGLVIAIPLALFIKGEMENIR